MPLLSSCCSCIFLFILVVVVFLFFFVRRRRRTRRLELDRAMNSALAAHGLTRTPLDGDDGDYAEDGEGGGSARASGSAPGGASRNARRCTPRSCCSAPPST